MLFTFRIPELTLILLEKFEQHTCLKEEVILTTLETTEHQKIEILESDLLYEVLEGDGLLVALLATCGPLR